MPQNSFHRRVMWGAASFAVALGLCTLLLRMHAAQPTFLMTYVQALSPLAYLGWLGAGELRRHGRSGQLRHLQFAFAAAAIPLAFNPGPALATALVTLAAAVMVLTFASGMRLRRAVQRG